MRTLLSIFSFLLLLSCEEEKFQETLIPEGTYHGTFQRQIVWTDSHIANISLTFTANQWSGTSDFPKYPALCRGTYSTNGDTILFENACVWTAEFDWTLILSGKYILTKTGKTIEFSRDYRSATTDTYVDQYLLTKQE